MKKIIIGTSLCLVFIFGVAFAADAAKPGHHKKAFFIHHSTGEIYVNGGMQEKMEAAGYSLEAPWWDGNTDPWDFPVELADTASWDIIGNNDILIFKSCYPASAITSDSELDDYKNWYRELYEIYEEHPDVLFVPMSTPPLPKGMTTYKQARRAMRFDKWFTHKYVENYSGNNLLPFRLHLQLGTKNGYLKPKYVADPNDGHPNSQSGIRVGNKIVRRLNTYFEN